MLNTRVHEARQGLGMAGETVLIVEQGVVTLSDERWEQARRRADVTLDRLMRILRRKSCKGGQEAWKMVHDAIADAQYDPETARALYGLASCGKRHDPVALERLCAIFIEPQVPPQFLPHENSDALSAL